MINTDQSDYITEVNIFDSEEFDKETAYNLSMQFIDAGLVHPREVRRNQVRWEERRQGIVPIINQETGEITYPRRGLSTAHIFSHMDDFIPAHVDFYENGDLITVRKNKLLTRYEEKKGGGKRGDVTLFSHASQRRLRQTTAKFNQKSEAPLFVTLTYPDEFSINGSEWKRHLKNFWQRLARQYPISAFLWVLELTKRKSGINEGNYAPHFHLLLFGISNSVELISWISRNWFEVVGSGNPKHLTAGTNVQSIRSWRRTSGYISKALKYISKAEQEELPEEWHTGRFWGIYGRSNISWANKWTCKLTEKEAIKLMRYLRKHARIKGRDYRSLTVIADSNQWSRRLEDLLYPN